MTKRWTRRPEGSTWGDWGPDDELGRMNLLGTEQVLKGVAEVKEGRAFLLSLPLDLPGGNLLNPRRHPPRLFATNRDGEPSYNFEVSRLDPKFTDVISDDAALIHLQYSTQWDALGHVGGRFDVDGDGEAEAVYYNGWRAGEDVVGPSEAEAPFEGPKAKRLGIEKMAETAVQGRAVMIDLRAHLGDARTLVDMEMLGRIMKEDGVTVEAGDMVCLHTGFADLIRGMAGNPDEETLHGACSALNGRDEALKTWVRDSGVVALIADNYAVEAHPAAEGHGDCCAFLPLHELCLFQLGVHLGELWWLSDLAAHLRAAGRSRFLLTAPPLNLPGAVGSPASPVGTV
ncbi:cyclase family protein [Albimonas sp. CAU 1670]|uniref:cyclase family protein n=1 Tax=Albimonas sp. CAU 1670 TaxID=3032599 RepID=UPI0023DC67D2|nr:cyclase family protein [Albimonas sp. CAU 1670]MDF2234589.1 cyclase family protein [Albimonas sp. CAU 1670]